MARFGIRNYGPSRQLSYRGQQICLIHDQCINTDDEKMAVTLGKADLIHVTDRGEEAAAPVIPEDPKDLRDSEDEVRKVTVDDAEAVHDEKFPDEDGKEERTQEIQQPVPDEDTDEITYADLNVKELQVLAKDRQLDTSGLKKADLIQVLEDYDAEE